MLLAIKMSFCHECNCISSRGHIRTTAHKEHCSINLDSDIKQVQTAFKNRIVTYHISSNKHLTNVKLFLQDLRNKVIILLRDQLKVNEPLRVNMELYGKYLLGSADKQEIKSFNSRYSALNRNTNMEDFFNDFRGVLLKKASEFTEMGSGWALSKLLFLELNINVV